jgi:hypothetical protein
MAMNARPTVFCCGVIFSVFPVWECSSLPGPGVYMLCKRDDLRGSRVILYIGETFNLAARLGRDHEHWAEALARGMNEVLVHLLAHTAAKRLAIETRLRRLVPTPLNRQSPGLVATPSRLRLGDLLPSHRNPFVD